MNEQTKQKGTTTRRSIFAGLLGLPAVAVIAHATVTGAPSRARAAGQATNWMPDVLRQCELRCKPAIR
jgi:hypothetical protein